MNVPQSVGGNKVEKYVSDKRRRLPSILIGVFIAVGLAVLFYPTVSNWLNAQQQQQSIAGYDDTAQQIAKEVRRVELARAEAYNNVLTGSGIRDPFIPGGSEKLPTDYVSILDVNDGIMGAILIPKIDVELPIYHGTSSAVLEKGVGHMEMTAFPIGGEGNHSVLTGHTALPGAVLFTDLDELVTGDQFFIKIYDRVFAYQVDQILVVEPTNTKPLLPQVGKDYVTLVTCTPYAINSHRLLVRGERIPYTPDESSDGSGSVNLFGFALHYDFFIALGALAAVIVFLILFLTKKRREKRKTNRELRGEEGKSDG